MPPPNSNPLHDPTEPVPDTPLDLSLLLTALRRMILIWRERATTATEREARIYRQVEADLSGVISSHSEMRSVWAAARRDLAQAIVAALDERDGRLS